jgi:hypothetical protein
VVKRDQADCRQTSRENPTNTMQHKHCPQASLCIHHLLGTMISEGLPAQVLVHPIAPVVPDRLIRFPCTLLQFDLD